MTLRKALCLVFALLFCAALAVSCNNTPSETPPANNEVKLTRIEIIDGTVETECYVGNEIDLSGIQVRAHYSNNSKKTIATEELSIVSPPDTSKEGQTMLIVGYGGLTASVYITVNESFMTSISVKGFESTYVYGSTISTENVVITVNYINGTSVDIPYGPGLGIELTIPSTFIIGPAQIDVKYQDLKKSVDTEIIDPLLSIALDTPYRTFAFREGYNQNAIKNILANLKVNATYTSGAVVVLGRDDVQIAYSQIDTTAPTTENKTFNIAYGGFMIQASYSVSGSSTFTALTLDPTNEFALSYLPGAVLDDLSKLKVKVVCSDGTTIDAVGIDNEKLKITGYEDLDISEIGAHSFDVAYVDGDDSVALTVTLNVYGIKSVSVSGIKTAYSVGDKFDDTYAGVQVTITYDNGESVTVDFANKDSNAAIISDKLVVVGSVDTENPGYNYIAFKYIDTESEVIKIAVAYDIYPDTDGDSNVTEKAPTNP